VRSPRRFWILVIIAALCAPGCLDRAELEDIAWVQAIGFDKGPEDFLSTTLEIGVPRTLRAGPATVGAAGGPYYITITVVSRTALEALDLAALNLGRRISLVHTQLFLFGEELARSDLRPLVGAMDRFREIRGSAHVAVAHGRAEDILRVNTSPLEVSPNRFIQTVMQQHQQTGLFEAATFVRDFTNLMESSSMSPRCPILSLAADYQPQKAGGGQGGSQGQSGQRDPAQGFPSTPKVGERVEPKVDLKEMGPGEDTTGLSGWQVPKIGGGPVIIMGTAMFNGGKMVGALTGEETLTAILIRNDFERGGFPVLDPTAPDKPELSMSVGAIGAKSKITVKKAESAVSVAVEVRMDVSYISPQTQTDYTDPRMTPLAERAVEDYIKGVMDRAIAKSQAVGSDIFGFGEKVRHTFLTWPEFEAFAWLTKYPATKIETTVHVKIKRYGLDLAPLAVPPAQIIQPPEQ
jgi:spore germination protein KC